MDKSKYNIVQTARIIGVVFLAFLSQAKITAQSKKMNVIFILADDLGWMDTGAYGSEYYETPNIDAFAKEGMLFTNAYSANPLCSPSRAALLTGRYPVRFDFTSATGNLKANTDMIPGLKAKTPTWQKVRTPEIRTYMPLEEQTIAEVLKEEGYSTIHIGKWHLGSNDYFPELSFFNNFK
ncbi:MAG: arylsulfatase A-like enzyme [Salibacteraceae bacterium]|jgi:arylsulfatase A-like enzyme